jgi:hypothetical protein
MFGLKKEERDPLNEAQEPGNGILLLEPRARRGWGYLADILLVLAMGSLLYYGYLSTGRFTNPHTDIARYQCYAEAFWRGTPALHRLPPTQCSFIKVGTTHSIVQKWKLHGWLANVINTIESHQSPLKPLHFLPLEYPLLTIIPFSLGLVGHAHLYRIVFPLWMALAAAIIYFILVRYRSREAAIAFAFYLVVGSWSTAGGRFDLIPAGFTLIALILAKRERWRWAFAALALATLFKFYALALIVPFLIAQQSQCRGTKWYAWQRWQPLGVFVLLCAVVTGISLMLSIEGTLAPLSYFEVRPIQVESGAASLLWLASFLKYHVHYVTSFGAVNIISPLSHRADILGVLGMVIGLLYTFWLQWRGKLGLFSASLLTLLIMIITGKVFSPQYLIWVTPLVAYIGKCNWKWLVSWGTIGLLTTLIYPYMYKAVHNVIMVPQLPAFQPVLLVRNVMVLGVILVLLYKAASRRPWNKWSAISSPGRKYQRSGLLA